MFGIPTPWLALGCVLACLTAAAGGYFKGRSDANANWEIAVSRQKIEAASLIAEAEKKAADTAQQNATLARNLDEQHAQHLQEIDATRDDFERDLTERVRNAERRASCSCSVSSASANSGQPETGSPGGDGGLPGIDTASLRRAADGANKLAALVRDVCVPWANQVGR